MCACHPFPGQARYSLPNVPWPISNTIWTIFDDVKKTEALSRIKYHEPKKVESFIEFLRSGENGLLGSGSDSVKEGLKAKLSLIPNYQIGSWRVLEQSECFIFMRFRAPTSHKINFFGETQNAASYR